MSSDFRQGVIVGAILTALAIFAFVGISKAESWMVLSGIAVHLDGHDHCNSTTTGLGVETGKYALGFYRNSNCRWSVYGARTWMPLTVGHVKAGLIGGAVTGYESRVTPVGGLALTWEGNEYGFNVIGIPPAGDKSTGVLWLQFKRRF